MSEDKIHPLITLVAIIIITILINRQSRGRLFGDFIDWLKSFPLLKRDDQDKGNTKGQS